MNSSPIRIVFPEGDDPRVREAADFLEANALAKVLLLTGADDLPQARELVQDEEADAVIAFAAPGQPFSDNAFLLLKREGKNGREETIILADIGAIRQLDPEKLLGVQPRLTVFPASEPTIAGLRAEHPLWLVGEVSQLDDVNILVVPDPATRDSLAATLKQFANFRVYGPISQAPVFEAGLSANATTADIIGTAECVAKLAK